MEVEQAKKEPVVGFFAAIKSKAKAANTSQLTILWTLYDDIFDECPFTKEEYVNALTKEIREAYPDSVVSITVSSNPRDIYGEVFNTEKGKEGIKYAIAGGMEKENEILENVALLDEQLYHQMRYERDNDA